MKTTKKATAWTPPAGSGVFYSYREGRPSPFLLRWKGRGDEPEGSAAYKDEDARERAARALVERRQAHGDAILQFDPARWRRYLEFQAIVGADVDPIIVAHEWRASKQGTPRAVGMLATDAAAKYMTLRIEEGHWGDDTIRHVRKCMERFSAAFPSKRLNEIGVEDVREWIFGRPDESGKRVGGLADDKGKRLGPFAIRHHLKIVRTFFERALREKWGALENPAKSVFAPRCDDGDPIVISLKDAFDFFAANRDEQVIGRVALEAFGAVRYTTAGKLGKDALNFERRGIRMAARLHKEGQKDGRSRYRQGHPENLWRWLAHAPDSCWQMTLHDYREQKRYAGIRAKIRPIDTSTAENRERVIGLRNVWRHSFISYHLARFKCPPMTKYLAQHSDEKMTADYEGMADEIIAARYFMITPETVLLSWEQFCALPVKPIAPMDSAAIAALLRVA
jgi:hypothetical protein